MTHVSPAVHIVTKKQVIGVRWETAKLKHPQKVMVLSVNVTYEYLYISNKNPTTQC